MKSRLILVAFLVLCPLYLPAQEWVLRFDGIGPVKIGMTVSQLNSVLHENFKREGACFQVSSELHPGIDFMIEDGIVSRVDVNDASVASVQGARVGRNESTLRKLLGRGAEIEDHKYFRLGHYLTVYSKHRRFAMRFETSGEKITNSKEFEAGTEAAKLAFTKNYVVTTFYAGRPKSIRYVEGCL